MSKSISTSKLRNTSQILQWKAKLSGYRGPPGRWLATSTAQAQTSPDQTDQSNQDGTAQSSSSTQNSEASTSTSSAKKPTSTAQRDEELRQKLAHLSGDGGEAGIEYEDGKPVAMKRSVRNNMFRYI